MPDWKQFFQTYRIIDIAGDSDLLFQVGATVGGKPISAEQFHSLIESISVPLDLNEKDGLIDLCCGNGVKTYELSKLVKRVVGIDVSRPYIENAIRYKHQPNISYRVHDVMKLKTIIKQDDSKEYNKLLLYDCLAYLTPPDLDNLLAHLSRVKAIIRILIGNVLDRDRKWKFFNTLNRRLMYFYQHALLGKDPGLGRWWTKNEVMMLAEKHGFVCVFLEQNPILSTAHYRFDALLTRVDESK